jgi:cold shock protein
MRITATVKFYNSRKGFGFIQPQEGSKDMFVHATALDRAGIRALNAGDRVSFELEDDRRGGGKQAAESKRRKPRQLVHARAAGSSGGICFLQGRLEAKLRSFERPGHGPW